METIKKKNLSIIEVFYVKHMIIEREKEGRRNTSHFLHFVICCRICYDIHIWMLSISCGIQLLHAWNTRIIQLWRYGNNLDIYRYFNTISIQYQYQFNTISIYNIIYWRSSVCFWNVSEWYATKRDFLANRLGKILYRLYKIVLREILVVYFLHNNLERGFVIALIRII